MTDKWKTRIISLFFLQKVFELITCARTKQSARTKQRTRIKETMFPKHLKLFNTEHNQGKNKLKTIYTVYTNASHKKRKKKKKKYTKHECHVIMSSDHLLPLQSDPNGRKRGIRNITPFSPQVSVTQRNMFNLKTLGLENYLFGYVFGIYRLNSTEILRWWCDA